MPGLGSVSSGLLHQEISRLNGLLEEKISECEQLERELVDIRRQGKERIQTLEQQVGASLPAFVACSQFGKRLFFCRKRTKSSLLSLALRFSSTQKILNRSVPTESERKARSMT